MRLKPVRVFAILFCVLGSTACQTTKVESAPSKIAYEDLSPELRQLSESATKCALAMRVVNSESYSSIEDVYFNNGDTYGELVSELDDSAKQRLLDNVVKRATKYAALHYSGDIAPVMLEYTFSQECNYLYFSEAFNQKHSELLEALRSL
ncbi:hypothetical protein P3439_24090 [Vibrio parahaemolyticus]|nr:hypothetical protein [Vibrio parahaemolyticus]